jgi:hypothetical protein
MAQKKASISPPGFLLADPAEQKNRSLDEPAIPRPIPVVDPSGYLRQNFLNHTHGVLSSKLSGVVEESSSFDLRVSDLSRDVFFVALTRNSGITPQAFAKRGLG